MQSNRPFDLSVKSAANTQAVATSVKSAPIELDLAVLKHVAGGSPNGTWSAATLTDSPNGTW
jgi:hypothetical protein